MKNPYLLEGSTTAPRPHWWYEGLILAEIQLL
jgi:hypothetical protein